MRSFIVAILILLTSQVPAQKNKWLNANDSILKENIEHFSEFCKSLSSSETISKQKISIDATLIETANSLYNIQTTQELEKLTNRFNKKELEKKVNGSLITIHFHPYTNGNLRLIYDGIFSESRLIKLTIQIATNTRLNCKEPGEPDIQYLDPIYIRDHFIRKINFPISHKLYDETIKATKTFE